MPNLLSAIDASASALDAQRTRMEVAISNMTNAESTRSAGGGPYRRREVVLTSQEFAKTFDGIPAGATGVRVVGIVDQASFKVVHDPTHVDADGEGNVSLPDIDVPEEMVDMLGAARAYQANLTAIGLIRDTIQRALELAK